MEDITLYGKATHSLNTNNGILNEDNLEFAKRTLLFNTIREYTEIVKTKQYYPHNDLSEVDLELDVVVINRNRYNKLKDIEDEVYKSEHSSKRKLMFPKLTV